MKSALQRILWGSFFLMLTLSQMAFAGPAITAGPPAMVPVPCAQFMKDGYPFVGAKAPFIAFYPHQRTVTVGLQSTGVNSTLEFTQLGLVAEVSNMDGSIQRTFQLVDQSMTFVANISDDPNDSGFEFVVGQIIYNGAVSQCPLLRANKIWGP